MLRSITGLGTRFTAVFMAVIASIWGAPADAQLIGPVRDFPPAWSPDGSQLVFSSDRTGNSDLFIINADGTGLRQLTASLLADAAPAWSPDGDYIVYYAVTESGGENLFVVDVNGENRRQLTTGTQNDNAPSWSPDGRQILFTSNRDEGMSYNLYRIGADGGGLERVTDTEFRDYRQHMSPDGTRIVFQRTMSRQNADIWIVNVNGTDARNLTDHPTWDEVPTWSPDGSRIRFTSRRSGRLQLWEMDPDGGNLVMLSHGPRNARGASWSPDDSKIAFQQYQTGARSRGLVVVQLNRMSNEAPHLDRFVGRYVHLDTWSVLEAQRIQGTLVAQFRGQVLPLEVAGKSGVFRIVGDRRGSQLEFVSQGDEVTGVVLPGSDVVLQRVGPR